MYSEKSFQEETVDTYRVILTNSYNDLLGAHGKIVSLFVDKDELYALTDRAAWFIPTRPQRLTTNESNIYVGTGDVLSIPPRRLSSPSNAYGGTTQRNSVLSTEFGTIYADDVTGKVFHLSDGLREISSEGMLNFFEEELSLKLVEYLSSLGTTYPHIDATTSPYSVGIQTTYDPRYKRIILHKRDFTPVSSK